MECVVCSREPTDNDEIYYHVRTTTTGRDTTNGSVDTVKCLECLESWIVTNGIVTIASMVRIENPMNVTGEQ